VANHCRNTFSISLIVRRMISTTVDLSRPTATEPIRRPSHAVPRSHVAVFSPERSETSAAIKFERSNQTRTTIVAS